MATDPIPPGYVPGERFRDPETGRFRVFRPDAVRVARVKRGRLVLVQLAYRYSEAEGVDFEEALWQVCKAMLVRAAQGDTAAAKLVLQYFAREDEPAPAARAKAGEGGGDLEGEPDAGPPVPKSIALADYMERLGGLVGELRREADDAARAKAAEEDLFR